MNRNARFDGDGKKRNLPYGRNLPARSATTRQRRCPGRTGFSLKWAWALVAIIAAGIYAADRYPVGDGIALTFTAPKADTLRATFPYCAEGHRVTCVVDGDTFWPSGEKIRIADIDTPEINPPRCEAERVKGEAAKRPCASCSTPGRSRSSPVSATKTSTGASCAPSRATAAPIGDMIAEGGLARRWDGARRSWCG